MAILPQEGFYNFKNPLVTDGPLDEVAPIEHLVPKRRPLPIRVEVPTIVGRMLLKDPGDIGAERGHLIRVEHTTEDDVSVCLEALH
jgi:hypothetical protein